MKRTIRLAALAALMLYALHGLPARADYESGKAAFEAADYPTAWHELSLLKDDPRAAFYLGIMAQHGWGTIADQQAAVAFYQIAVKGGHVQAMVNLGVMVDQGRGIQPSGLVAQDLFLAAVRAGDAKGKNDLAYLWARQGGLLEEALCLSSQALQVEPHHGGYLNVHGFILQRLGRSAEARRFFELALHEFGNDDFALEQLGDMAYAQHDLAAAKRYWQRALAATPTVVDADRLRDKLGGWYHNPLPHSEFEFKNPDDFGRDCGQQTS